MPGSEVTVGVLVPVDPEAPPLAPEQRPLGRAALLLRDEGVRVVFGDRLAGGRMWGVEARPGRWVPGVGEPVRALHDRYPSQVRSRRFAELLAGLDRLPLANPVALTWLCRDKLACQRYLEARGVAMPAVSLDPSALDGWGAAFAKPRFGSLGVGVRRLVRGQPVPSHLPGVVPGASEPVILQRAVPPPPGWAGRSLRVLCQRLPGGEWALNPAVLRQSRTDPVVNAERGAEVAVAADVLGRMEPVMALCEQVCLALGSHPEGRWLVEVGVDLVLDREDRPHVIEVNSRPRGRLEVLAHLDPARFGQAHVEACARPLRYLAAATGA